jgi:PIN domain nuclease of toxin-antitoxin system
MLERESHGVKLLLDTCAILHLAAEPHRLTPAAREALQDPAAEVNVSVVSIAELACLSNLQRIVLEPHWKTWFRRAVDQNGWNWIEVDARVAEEAWSLPEIFHRDPSDRLLVATARIHQLTLVTTDQWILDYPHVESMG